MERAPGTATASQRLGFSDESHFDKAGSRAFMAAGRCWPHERAKTISPLLEATRIIQAEIAAFERHTDFGPITRSIVAAPGRLTIKVDRAAWQAPTFIESMTANLNAAVRNAGIDDVSASVEFTTSDIEAGATIVAREIAVFEANMAANVTDAPSFQSITTNGSVITIVANRLDAHAPTFLESMTASLQKALTEANINTVTVVIRYD